MLLHESELVRYLLLNMGSSKLILSNLEQSITQAIRFIHIQAK